MNSALIAHIEYLLCIKIGRSTPLSGGDISQAFLLETDTERFFCKVNLKRSALAMFRAEKLGLEAIANTKTVATPKILLCEEWEPGGFLVLEYIETRRPTAKDMELLGHQLAALHLFSSSDNYGFSSDNFIGSLHQSNKFHQDWPSFYVMERLLPQLRMAKNAKRLSSEEIPSTGSLVHTCANLFPKTKPSLIHGDLWSGNYLVGQNGTPYLIDPAVCFGHHEMDIAMTKLFGGFAGSFYGAYTEHFTKTSEEKERCAIYQLYYLLVHLNLFGKSYYQRCKEILEDYFQ